MPRMISDPTERFWAKVDKTSPNGCWLWKTAILKRHGYGLFRISLAEGCQTAHRFAYELVKGPVPPGLQIDHLCRVRHCVNPDHLEAVTQAENLRRGREWRKEHASRKAA